ncbi:hypothetical protein IW261DRAFT_1561951 [Armillaria novae-zelandiae]|uniref:DUF6534 domain-containing protein n=1 Tax=Armillaria novae-zelandiae TaxID=153914 RepID=A0AA39PEC6_9AGAR|nr:hypothetical protein IW261DRAFT_1561951 [Armillaria novae-zelandiae]
MSDAGEFLADNVRSALGPILAGVTANAFIFGICTVQYYEYFTSGIRDSWILLGTVVWLAVVDVLFSINSAVILWQYVIDNFANPAVLHQSNWHFNLVPLFLSLTSVPVHIFLANRIGHFSKSWALFGSLVLLSSSASALASVSAIRSQLASEVVFWLDAEPPALTLIGLSLGVACDVLMTGLLLYYLRRDKKAFLKTNRKLSACVQISIQSAVPSTICTVVILVLIKTLDPANFQHVFTFCSAGCTRLRFCPCVPFIIYVPIRRYLLVSFQSLNFRPTVREMDSLYGVNSIDLLTIRRHPAAHDFAVRVTQETKTLTDTEWPIQRSLEQGIQSRTSTQPKLCKLLLKFEAQRKLKLRFQFSKLVSYNVPYLPDATLSRINANIPML